MARARQNRGPMRADSACVLGAGPAAPATQTRRTARSVRTRRCRRLGGGPGGGRSAQSVPEHRGKACQIRGGPDAETQIMGRDRAHCPGRLRTALRTRRMVRREGLARGNGDAPAYLGNPPTGGPQGYQMTLSPTPCSSRSRASGIGSLDPLVFVE